MKNPVITGGPRFLFLNYRYVILRYRPSIFIALGYLLARG